MPTLGQPNGALKTPWHDALELSTGERDTLTNHQLLRLAEAELLLRRPNRALAALSHRSLPDSLGGGAVAGALAEIRRLQGDHREAGAGFVRAASYAVGFTRGVYHARAADAYQRAGLLQTAAALYAQAAVDLPEASGWLGLREARLLPDTAVAFALLRNAPAAARTLAAELRAAALGEMGNHAAAAQVLASVGRYVLAARAAAAAGDSALARRLVYRAVAASDRAEARAGIDLALAEFAPQTAGAEMAIGRALRQHGTWAEALPFVEAGVAGGDSSASALTLLGDLREITGDRSGAISAYGAAALGTDEQAGEAEYRGARGHLRMREVSVAAEALMAFLNRHPRHDRAPAALYLLGDLRQDQGRLGEADSIYLDLHARWPASSFASTARARLATRALRRNDVARAVELYRFEIEHGGSRARASQYEIARLALRAGDSVAAQLEWAALASADSIGYYGTAARQAAGLPTPRFPDVPRDPPSPDVLRELAALDIMTAAGFEAETTAITEHLLDVREWSVADLMDIAEGLIARGRARIAITLGWRIASLHRLNDARVLRMIFPWPERELTEREAREFDLDPYLVAALIRQESAFDAAATSRAGARGMMQLMPPTARGLARQLGVDWTNAWLGVPDANMHLGTAHLATMLRQYDREVVPALAAYNAGGSRVRRWLRFPEAGNWFDFIERIPFPETRGYVQTLLRNRVVYEALYGADPLP